VYPFVKTIFNPKDIIKNSLKKATKKISEKEIQKAKEPK